MTIKLTTSNLLLALTIILIFIFAIGQLNDLALFDTIAYKWLHWRSRLLEVQ